MVINNFGNKKFRQTMRKLSMHLGMGVPNAFPSSSQGGPIKFSRSQSVPHDVPNNILILSHMPNVLETLMRSHF
jgi:hypothetical protein